MVDWKLYIDSPQKRALKLCYGSLTEGNGFGCGYGWGSGGGGCDGGCDGGGWGYGFGGGNGRSSTEW